MVRTIAIFVVVLQASWANAQPRTQLYPVDPVEHERGTTPRVVGSGADDVESMEQNRAHFDREHGARAETTMTRPVSGSRETAWREASTGARPRPAWTSTESQTPAFVGSNSQPSPSRTGRRGRRVVTAAYQQPPDRAVGGARTQPLGRGFGAPGFAPGDDRVPADMAPSLGDAPLGIAPLAAERSAPFESGAVRPLDAVGMPGTCVCAPTLAAPGGPYAGGDPGTVPPELYSRLPRFEAVPGTYVVGRGILGQPKLYVQGQPILNTLRFLTP